MADVDDALVQEAIEALDVVDVEPLRGGAQKTVQLVERDGNSLVMKVIALGSSTPDSLRRAEREVELLASLNSAHVVRVESALVELGEPVRGAAWLEEHLDGSDLTDLLFTREWSWEETARLGVLLGDVGAAGDRREVAERCVGPVVVVVVQPA